MYFLGESNRYTTYIFDISKAFDKVWHKGLLFKLESIRIKYLIIKWLDKYLSNRRQRVVINGKSVSWKTINADVQQGLVPGPLLFLIYINDIGSNLSCKTTLFADDTTLSKHTTNPIITANTLQCDLTIIEDCADNWKVKFDPLISAFLYQVDLIGFNHCLHFKIRQSTMCNNILT